jgi:hypothetical protein
VSEQRLDDIEDQLRDLRERVALLETVNEVWLGLRDLIEVHQKERDLPGGGP